MNEQWLQGNWNAWVVFDCTKDQSRTRCRQVTDKFKDKAIEHARAYWAMQDRQPAPAQPAQEWTLVEIAPEHWAAGKAHLEGANWEHMERFGDQEFGFAAEHAVADWFARQGVDHNHNPDPRNTNPDFTIHGLTVDLKSVSTKGAPRPDYDADLAERQRLNKPPNWYLFGKHNNTTPGDYYILGFQTEQVITEKGVFYRKGEITQKNMKAPVDCWCIEYRELIKPLEWLAQVQG